LVINNWKKIKKIYDNYTDELSNRYEDVWIGILILSEFFDVKESVLGFAKKNIEDTLLTDIENDRNYLILKTLLDVVDVELRGYHISNFVSQLKQKIDFGDKNVERSIGWHLSSLNLFKKGRDGVGITYELNKEKILLAMISRGYPIPENYDILVKKLHKTTLPTKTTITTLTTLKNNNDNYKGKNVDNVDNVVNSMGIKNKTIKVTHKKIGNKDG